MPAVVIECHYIKMVVEDSYVLINDICNCQYIKMAVEATVTTAGILFRGVRRYIKMVVKSVTTVLLHFSGTRKCQETKSSGRQSPLQAFFSATLVTATTYKRQ